MVYLRSECPGTSNSFLASKPLFGDRVTLDRTQKIA